MQLVYDDEIHRYYVNGIIVPCVSEIVSLIREPFDEKNLGGRTLQDHADEGTYMHNVAESIMLDEDFNLNNCSWECMDRRVDALLDFKTKITEVVATEQVVYNDRLNYIGRVDLVADIENELTLVDYKKGTPNKYGAMSTLLYVMAWNEGFLFSGEEYWIPKRKITRRMVIQPTKDGKIKYLNQEYIDLTTEECAESLINLYNWKNKRIR